MTAPDGVRVSQGVGAVAGAAGIAASLFLLFGPVVRYSSVSSDGTRTTGTVSGIDYVLGSPHAQFELFAWPVLLGLVAIGVALAAWTGRTSWTWAAALTLTAFSIVGVMSIGLVYAPAAVLALVAAGLGRRESRG